MVPTLLERWGSHVAAKPAATAYTFLRDAEDDAEPWSYRELDLRARTIAAQLRELAPGARVMLHFAPGLEFVAAFLGCLHAGVIAVPVAPPALSPGAESLARFAAIAKDARPAGVLTDGARPELRERLSFLVPELWAAAWIDVSASHPRPTAWIGTPPAATTIALLQYTSGSTSAPKGVIVTHANLAHNLAVTAGALFPDGVREHSRIVSWLPFYHDMGLGKVLAAAYTGAPCVLMSPLHFIQRPYRWLRAISTHRGTISGGPNFAYDLCTQKVSAAERATLDLSTWTVALNGAEPVRQATLERFGAAFAACGFRRAAHHPCYGLAEATLMVTGGPRPTPLEMPVKRSAYERGTIEPCLEADDAQTLVSSGEPQLDVGVRIVDPVTCAPCVERRVGEIWVSGDSVTAGYWNQPEATRETFGARIDGLPGTFLRTGDLGFLAGGALFVTGRIKDLVIVRGRKLYAQDIEAIVESAVPAVRTGGTAVFGVSEREEEQIVVVASIDAASKADAQRIIADIRGCVSDGYRVAVHAVALIRAGTLPKTTSGKPRRHAARRAFLHGTLVSVATWPSAAC